MGEMRIMDVDAGDLKLIWDADNKDEVKAAKKQFDTLVKEKKTHQAYKVKKDGSPGKKIDQFDPEAEKIILAPAMVGG